MMNFRALKIATRQQLRDVSPGGFQWGDLDVMDAVNWACERLCTTLGITYVGTGQPTVVSPTDTAAPFGSNLVAGKAYTTPTLCIDVKDAYLQKGSPMSQRILNPTTVLYEDRKNPQWRVSNDPPTAWMNVDGNHIMINGVVPAGYALYVGYIERPQKMVLDGDVPDTRIQEYYHQHLAYAAAARLLSMAGTQQDMARSDKLFKQFLDLIGAGEADVAQNPVDK